jgi:hypothetical protein
MKLWIINDLQDNLKRIMLIFVLRFFLTSGAYFKGVNKTVKPISSILLFLFSCVFILSILSKWAN